MKKFIGWCLIVSSFVPLVVTGLVVAPPVTLAMLGIDVVVVTFALGAHLAWDD